MRVSVFSVPGSTSLLRRTVYEATSAKPPTRRALKSVTDSVNVLLSPDSTSSDWPKLAVSESFQA